MKLNLGAADRRIEGFISVDIAPPADQIVDLSGQWTWPDSSVDEVLALDVCEHIGDCDHVNNACSRCLEYHDGLAGMRGLELEAMKRRHPLGKPHFMNELWRVLKPGALATIETPNAAKGCGYFQDPTHVSPWCLSTFKYFEHGTFAHGRLSKAYGITAAFKVLALTELQTSGEDAREIAWKIKAVLEAVK